MKLIEISYSFAHYVPQNLKRKKIYIRSQMSKNGRQICKKKIDCKQAKNLGFNMELIHLHTGY